VGRKKIPKRRQELNKQKHSDIWETKSKPMSKESRNRSFSQGSLGVFLEEKKKRKEQDKAERKYKKRRYLGQAKKQQGKWKIYPLEKLEEMKVCKKNLRIKKKIGEREEQARKKMENEETGRKK
jgi:hypothetical protein